MRVTLIKCALSVPYANCFTSPKKTLDEMQKIIRKFMWNKVKSQHYTPRVP